jgi:hypothetical protein
MQLTLFSLAIFAFSISKISISLDSTKFHTNVLFLDHTTPTFIAHYNDLKHFNKFKTTHCTEVSNPNK